MLNRLSLLLLTKLLWAVVALLLVAACLLALRTHDAHWINRVGALIAALAAGSVLLQIVVEIGLERRRHEIEEQHGARGVPEPLLPIDRLAARLQAGRSREEIHRLERHRLMVASRVVVCAIVGELLHGFGDVTACATFVDCRSHEAAAPPQVQPPARADAPVPAPR